MQNKLEERDWDILLNRINDGKCTPFLGAGACFGALPLGSEIAQKWAKKYDYPLNDSANLVRVAQFLAVQYDPLFPKEEIVQIFKNLTPPDFTAPDEPHGVLASLPLPVYMTTNYDDFMAQALKDRYKDSKREICRWNVLIKDHPSVFETQADFSPTVANPVVFHLHGHNEAAESLVLTEDDYLEFLANIARDPDLLPLRIQKALAGSSLLFVGYRLADWNFRVLFQALRPSLQRLMSVAVLVPPRDTKSARKKAQEYLNRYYESMDLRVYWGTAREFSAELRKRWDDFSK